MWMQALAVLGQSVPSCRQSQPTFSKMSRSGTFLECGRTTTGAGGIFVTQVLIVDDDAAIRETLRFILEDSGYTVLEERDGLGALQRLRRSEKPMVVLLDLMMPGLSGAGVLKEISGDARLEKRFAFVLVTASNQVFPRSLTGLLATHSIPIISKPWDMEHLLKTVAAGAKQISSEEAR